MQIPVLFVVLFACFTAVFAAPIGEVERRVNAAIFEKQTYNQLSISGGKAGTAQAQALAKFSALNLNDAKNVAKADLDFLDSVNKIANNAETQVFNPAVDAATGAAKTALQVTHTDLKEPSRIPADIFLYRTARFRIRSSSLPPLS